MKNQKLELKKEETKEVELVIHEVEDESVIVNLNGWRMRLYFDQGIKKDKFRTNQLIIAKYKGDIEDTHSIRFEKIR